MFIFVIQTMQIKWNKICIKQLAGGKHMENNCFLKTLKFKMTFSMQLHVGRDTRSINILNVGPLVLKEATSKPPPY